MSLTVYLLVVAFCAGFITGVIAWIVHIVWSDRRNAPPVVPLYYTAHRTAATVAHRREEA